jgi:hypothetical protein
VIKKILSLFHGSPCKYLKRSKQTKPLSIHKCDLKNMAICLDFVS